MTTRSVVCGGCPRGSASHDCRVGDSPRGASQSTRRRPCLGGTSPGCAKGVLVRRCRLRSTIGVVHRLGWRLGSNAVQPAFAGVAAAALTGKNGRRASR
jgi:hypothetical protein